jgi:prepilin-type N-terminal cleavage/methylation domain-containing protein
MINHHNRQNGFTLLELMVVVAIGSIVVMMAVPSLRKMNAHLGLKKAAETLMMDFRRAQSLAVRQNSTHRLDFTLNTPVVAPAPDGSQYNGMYQVVCPASCATDSLPPARYLGTADGSSLNTSTVSGNSPAVSLVSTTDGANAAATSLSFASNGIVSVPSLLPFTVTLRAMQTGETMYVQVCRTGRVRVLTAPAVC